MLSHFPITNNFKNPNWYLLKCTLLLKIINAYNPDKTTDLPDLFWNEITPKNVYLTPFKDYREAAVFAIYYYLLIPIIQ